MKREDFGYHELYCVQRWVRVIREVSETHVFEDSEEKEERGDVVIVSDTHETPFQETTREGINDLLADVHEVDDDILTAPDSKPRTTGDTD